MQITTLTPRQLDALREQAAKRRGSFVDPAQLRRVQQFVAGRHEWASAVIGKPFSLRAMTGRELVLLDLAASAEPNPPVPPRMFDDGYEPTEAERAQSARQQAKAAEWAALRKLLPDVRVVHNYTSRRHGENYVQGVEHILVTADLHVGGLHRDAGHALCFTPAKARHQRHLSLNDPWMPEDDERLPTCKACLRIAHRIAEAA